MTSGEVVEQGRPGLSRGLPFATLGGSWRVLASKNKPTPCGLP
jgi:hypothetical protein